VHLKAVRQSGGDIDISWIRRGRIDADSWLGSEIPLGEEAEAYRVDIATGSGDIVRSLIVALPSFTYTAVSMAEDFPATPESIRIAVCQISAAIGPGAPASTVLTLG
jgi:hypothetical protein